MYDHLICAMLHAGCWVYHREETDMRPGLRQFTEINPVTFLLISQCKKTEKYVCKHAYNRNTCDNTTIVMCKL